MKTAEQLLSDAHYLIVELAAEGFHDSEMEQRIEQFLEDYKPFYSS